MQAKKRYLTTIGVGALVLLTGIFLEAFTGYDSQVAQSGITTAGMVMIVIGLVYLIRKKEAPKKDERTRKIADRSAGFSWVITLLSLLGIYWLNLFDVIEFTVNQVIWGTYFIMVVSMIVFQRYFWHKGDVS